MAATLCSARCADSVKQLCQQYSAAASNVKQGLQDEALHLQADFQQRLADRDHERLKLESSHYSGYLQLNCPFLTHLLHVPGGCLACTFCVSHKHAAGYGLH